MTILLPPEALLDLIVQGEDQMDPHDLRIWDLIKMEPSKWFHVTMKKVWAVGLTGNRVLWHDHWEDGFRITNWTTLLNIGSGGSVESSLARSIKPFRGWIDNT